MVFNCQKNLLLFYILKYSIMNSFQLDLILVGASAEELYTNIFKHNIQQYMWTKQQKQIGKHQQFESLEGNISPAALHPINQLT